MKKLTIEDWDTIQKNRPARYFIQNVEDGKVRVKFDTEIYKVETGDQDGLGNVWDKDWNKIEAKATILDHKDKANIGASKIYSLGGEGFSFFSDFIACCKNNGVRPEDVPGAVFDITKTDQFKQEIIYIGREGSGTVNPTGTEVKEDLLADAKEVVKNLKESSPDLVKLGFSKEDFLKILDIRGKIKRGDAVALLPKLESNSIIKTEGDRIAIL